MLLNEFLKAHQKIEAQEATIARLSSADAKQEAEMARVNQEQKAINSRLEATVAKLQSVLKAQAAQIQQVSEQLRTPAQAPRVVANNQ